MKALMGNSKRSVHVVATVAFAVMVISTCFAVAHGFVSVVNRLTWGYTVTDLFIVYEGGESLSGSVVDSGFLEALPEEVGFCSVHMGVVTQPMMGALDLYGVDMGTFTAVRRPRVQGEFPDEPGEVLIGAVLALNHGVVPGTVFEVEAGGQNFSLSVTGIVRCSSSYDLGLVTSEENYVSLLGDSGYQYIELRVPDVAGFDVSIGDGYGLEVRPLMAMKEYIGVVAGEIRADLALLSLIIAVIASLLICHTTYKIVYDSVNELRLIRCMGVTRRGLYTLILLDSTLLCVSGALLGLLLGIVFANVLSIGVFVFLRSMYYPARFEAEIALYCLALALFLGLLGGITAITFVNPEKRMIRGEVA